jgi:two-component system CheB/CheR fusion protein
MLFIRKSMSEMAQFPKRVLVVDDNEASALTLTWAMEMQGCDVKTCFDGKSAVAVAQEFQPEVVLLDLGMPIMDGFEVCRQLRENPVLRNTRVVAQTGWGDAETRRKTADAGFNFHLTKPLDLDVLWQILQSESPQA